MNQPRRRPRSRAASRAQTGRGLRNGLAGLGGPARPRRWSPVAPRQRSQSPSSGALPPPPSQAPPPPLPALAPAGGLGGRSAAAATAVQGQPQGRGCAPIAELQHHRRRRGPSGRAESAAVQLARPVAAGPVPSAGTVPASVPSQDSAPPPPQPGRGWAHCCCEPPALAGDAGGDAEGGRADRWGRRRCALSRPRDAAAPVLVARTRQSARRLCELRRERERGVGLCRPRRPGRAASDSGPRLPPSVQRPGLRAADAHWAAEGTPGTRPPCSAPVWRANG
ncbi:hypothetical protein HispidOSU_028139, partial [Sigmodon hispidus]